MCWLNNNPLLAEVQEVKKLEKIELSSKTSAHLKSI